MWDALEAKYGVSDAGNELYVMKQFHDYRMIDDCSVVEQAHEIQTMAKELENFGTMLPNKFVAGCIIAKLSQAWTDFATSLKYKRQEFSITDLIGSLDVEEKMRAQDVCGQKIVERSSSAHVVQKNSQNSHKKKFKQEFKQKNTVPFNNKKENKEKGNVASPGIMLRSARRASGSPKRNQLT